MNIKVYNNWNEEKKRIATKKGEAIFFEKEIWLVSLGQNLGVEIIGKNERFVRPVLVYRKYNRNQALVFPLTTKGKLNRFYYKLENVRFLSKISYLTLSQIRVLDQKRFFRKLGKVSVGQFKSIQKSAQAMLEPQSPRWL